MVPFDLVKEFTELNTKVSSEERSALIEYCTDIQAMAENNIGIPFKNKGAMHAAVVMAGLFLNAEERIRIFAGNLNGDVSGISIWKKSLEAVFAAKENLFIDVILEQVPNEKSIGLQTLTALKRKAKDRVCISVIDSSDNTIEPQLPKDFHFTVVDDKRFRIETDKTTYKASCNFDDKEMAATLIDLFLLLKTFTKELIS